MKVMQAILMGLAGIWGLATAWALFVLLSSEGGLLAGILGVSFILAYGTLFVLCISVAVIIGSASGPSRQRPQTPSDRIRDKAAASFLDKVGGVDRQ